VDIRRINVISKYGLQPITTLGKLERKKAVPTIRRRDRQRIIQIDGFLSKSTAGIVQAELDKGFEKIDFKPRHGYRYAGNAEYQEESQRETSKAALIAMILTFMLLAAILNSFLHPFTIASSIVTSFTGVFLIMFLTNSSVNVASMLSMVMLIGLAVNNAILILDTTMRRQSEGHPLIESIWFGIENKFRAVLMTSIAIIFGVLPQLRSINGGKASMGAVIAGGMIGSLVFTFLMIPLIYYYLEKLKGLFLKKR
jgi:HAE1 family hydrophobic/amphiphilic exporter-1